MKRQEKIAAAAYAAFFAERSEWKLQQERDQIEQAERRRKTFVHFFKLEELSVVDYMKSLPEKDEFTKNYLLFMETLGKTISAELTHCREAVSDYPYNIIGEVLECGCQCHEISLLCTLRDPHLRTFFGFVDGYDDNQYVGTGSHSFLMSPCSNVIYDMVLQYRMNDYHDMEQLRGYARNYFGVEIPREILVDVHNARPKNVYANHSRYFKEEVFTSRPKTEMLIERIQNLNKSP